MPIPECNKTGGEIDSDKTTREEAELAREAMQAIARLLFRPEYEPEKYILVGSLAIANTLDRVLGDGIHEQPTGEVVIGPEEARGRAIHP